MPVASYLQDLLQDGPAYNLSSLSSFAHFYFCAGKESLRHKMPSLLSSIWSISKAAVTYAHTAHFYSGSSTYGGSPPVCSNPGLSCQNTTPVQDTCCFNYPGGQLLQTQFWDTNPPTGPVDSWTIHGLWPDHCDGTYDANCDASREYTNISSIISAAGQRDLLNYMNMYWKDYQGNDESFWEHEWGKHGTCISTLRPSCYTNYVPQEEVVDFFQKTVDLFKTLNSYQFLSAAGIVPSSTNTYTAAAINAALKAPRGVSVAIQCDSSALNEIWYFFNVRGSVQTGTFVATDPDGSKSDCPATGIKYLPKTGGSTPPPSSPSGKGTLPITVSGVQKGCVISGGTWYTTGTCASFTATAAGSGFTLTSSKGKCAVLNNVLTCASTVSTATVFTLVDGHVAYNGNPTWYANGVPSGTTQATISATTLSTSLTIDFVAS
ncbi:ribonuclease T2-like [Sticta canariensis]|nr:ribonuclease T2-like [Sticta canariensis]